MRVLFVAAFLISAIGACGGGGGGGGGAEPQPTVITDVAGLQAMREDSAGNYVLGNDIDGTATSTWNGGAGFEPVPAFTGTLDGAGFEIAHLFIDRPDEGVGMFDYVADGGSVRNVHLTGASVTGRRQVGILSGINWGTIRNCSTAGTVSGSAGIVGGLTGGNQGTILYCSSSATVENTGTATSGGLVGDNRGSIARSYATGEVTVPGDTVGGLVGSNLSGTITDCYSTASVHGDETVGGLVGKNGYDGAVVENCYSSGLVAGGSSKCGGLVGVHGGTGWGTEEINHCFTVSSTSGGSYVGGLVGWSSGADIVGGYWDLTRTGQLAGSGLVNAGDQLTGVNAVNLLPGYFYVSSNAPLDAWDFTTVWQIVEGVSFPTLRPDPE